MTFNTTNPSSFAGPGAASAILDLRHYDPPGFLAAVSALLANPAAMLNVPSAHLLAFTPEATLARYLDAKYPKDSSVFDAMGGIVSNTGKGAQIAGIVLTHWFKTYKHAKRRNPAPAHLKQFTISRPLVTLGENERRMLLAVAQLAARGIYTPQQWTRFVAVIAWNGATCLVTPTPAFETHERASEMRGLLIEILRAILPDHRTFIAETAAHIAQYPDVIRNGPASAGDDARWMTTADLSSSPILTSNDTPGALLLGYHPDNGAPVLYDGHESMITIGGPGSGKSQAHVIPNLLRYPGSAIVLDVKGELWDATAGYRMRFGPVYRFAPTDPSGRTHRYNPFDFISNNPDQAAVDCSVFSYQVIADNPNLHDPFWEGKARDFVWAFAMYLALSPDPDMRNLETLSALFGLEVPKKRAAKNADDDDDEEEAPQEPNEFMGLIQQLLILGHQTGIPDLIACANAMLGSMGNQRLESILDNARRHLAVFGRAGFTRTALSASDWSPQQLRSKPGTTVYICIPPGELKAFAPIVRLMLTQHSRILQRYAAKPDELPITFFLDEMPQLGNFKSILEVQDVGRGAGLRLWMFAQSLGQLSEAFGRDRYAGVVNTCRVRSFLQPDAESAKFIAPNLGQTHNLFTNEKHPLAPPNELMGRAFIDKVIVTTRGDYPMALDRRMAWQTMADRIDIQPPLVPPAARP